MQDFCFFKKLEVELSREVNKDSKETIHNVKNIFRRWEGLVESLEPS